MTAFADRYIGRFAPSPTGALHFGSLLAAVASYLDARHHQGRWLVRIEDLDPPREQPGAAAAILTTLEAYGLEWDGPVLYQSSRLAYYQHLQERLLQAGLAYRCDCSRQRIAQRTRQGYDGFCRNRQHQLAPPCAVRARLPATPLTFDDRIQGPQRFVLPPGDDAVIWRRDGLCAYQLAVVADDHTQGITHIVRGSDLLDATPRQQALQAQLAMSGPSYAHIPVMVNAAGQKLSKQTFASALDPTHPSAALYAALRVLGQQPPAELRGAPARSLLQWGIEQWRITAVPARLTLPESLLQAAG